MRDPVVQEPVAALRRHGSLEPCFPFGRSTQDKRYEYRGYVEQASDCDSPPNEPFPPAEPAEQVEVQEEESQFHEKDHKALDGGADNRLYEAFSRVIANDGIPNMFSATKLGR